MALSDNLRNVTAGLSKQAAGKAGLGEAGAFVGAQQALTQQAQGGKPLSPQLPQQIASGVTQQAGQAALGSQAQAGQQIQQAGAQAVQFTGQRRGRQLQAEQQMSNRDIAQRQRNGELRQNDTQLRQAKKLQAEDIVSQRRMQQTGIEFNNNISFLTRKQREDLASLGRLVKQQVFDSRLQFGADERGRKFSNARQLADYAVSSSRDRQELGDRLRQMQQAYEKEQILFDAVNKKIVQAIELEYKKKEQERDQALIQQLAEMRRNAEKEQRRRAAKAQAINSIIIGGATVAGAVIGGGAPGAAAGAAAGQAVAGGLQSGGVY